MGRVSLSGVICGVKDRMQMKDRLKHRRRTGRKVDGGKSKDQDSRDELVHELPALRTGLTAAVSYVEF